MNDKNVETIEFVNNKGEKISLPASTTIWRTQLKENYNT